MIHDEVTIECIGGKGGSGLVSFRREKFVPRGGPDGGDGGRGGSVIIIAKENTRTLTNLNNQKIFRAGNAKSGGDTDRHGADGEDLYIPVPVGSQIYTLDKKHLIADLTEENQEYKVVKGGRGGYGNVHFVSSRFQAPKIAEIGEEGERMEILIELKLIADVGIIGLPSAGKSTLISVISNAKPKIAAYHFTTLSPNLGVVDLTKTLKEPEATFVVADIPGLIEGANEGKGLGHEFLRHVQRTKTLIHMIDAAEEDIPKAYKVINAELKKFDKNLVKKPQIVVINKKDLIPPEDQEAFLKDIQKKLKIKKIFFISAAINDGVPALMKEVWKMVKEEEAKEKLNAEKNAAGAGDIDSDQPVAHKVFRPHLENKESFEIIYLKKLNKQRYYEIKSKRIEQLAKMMDLTNLQAQTRVRQYMKKLGIEQALTKKGATESDIIIIAGKEIPYFRSTSWKKRK